MTYNILRHRDRPGGLANPGPLAAIRDDLTRNGWTLLRGFQPQMEGVLGPCHPSLLSNEHLAISHPTR